MCNATEGRKCIQVALGDYHKDTLSHKRTSSSSSSPLSHYCDKINKPEKRKNWCHRTVLSDYIYLFFPLGNLPSNYWLFSSVFLFIHFSIIMIRTLTMNVCRLIWWTSQKNSNQIQDIFLKYHWSILKINLDDVNMIFNEII